MPLRGVQSDVRAKDGLVDENIWQASAVCSHLGLSYYGNQGMERGVFSNYENRFCQIEYSCLRKDGTVKDITQLPLFLVNSDKTETDTTAEAWSFRLLLVSFHFRPSSPFAQPVLSRVRR